MDLQLFTKRQNFTQVQIQSICRRQNKSDQKIEICLGKDRKHCGKRRKCCFPAFSAFPTVFSQGLFPRVIKSRGCVLKVSKTVLHVFKGLSICKTKYILWIFNPFPNKPWFLYVCSTSLLETLWEKEKLLFRSNFSFSHSVFYSFG